MNYKIRRTLKISILITLGVLGLYSCQCNGQEEEKDQQTLSPKELKNQRINARKDFIERENASIEAYITDRDFDMQRSGTGLFYSIERDSSNLDSIKPKDQVLYNYKVYMLNGSLLYDSRESLVIDRQDAIIGLHEALQKMTLGDKGVFIIPSHLAYGVSGDQNKVPPLTALQYDLEVLKVNKSNKPK